jgi:hypothetical protein
MCAPTVQSKTLISKYSIVRNLITVSQVIFPKCYCLWAKAICCRIFQYISNMFFSSVLSGPLHYRIATFVAFRQLPLKPQRFCTGKIHLKFSWRTKSRTFSLQVHKKRSQGQEMNKIWKFGIFSLTFFVIVWVMVKYVENKFEKIQPRKQW